MKARWGGAGGEGPSQATADSAEALPCVPSAQL